MKIKILFIILFWGILGCSLGLENDKEVCHSCETENDCGKGEFCIETWPVIDCNKDESCAAVWPFEEQNLETKCESFTRCNKGPCETINIDCNAGECTYNPTNRRPICNCNEGVNIYQYKEFQGDNSKVGINICLEDTYCETREDCSKVFKLNDNNEFIDLSYCYENKCISRE